MTRREDGATAVTRWFRLGLVEDERIESGRDQREIAPMRYHEPQTIRRFLELHRSWNKDRGDSSTREGAGQIVGQWAVGTPAQRADDRDRRRRGHCRANEDRNVLERK